jgi:ribosome-associated translation inhibitor RaiA
MALTIHPRHFKVREAKNKIELAILKLLEKHELTYGEINGIMLEIAQSLNKHAIRHERHPEDPEKKGDEA